MVVAFMFLEITCAELCIVVVCFSMLYVPERDRSVKRHLPSHRWAGEPLHPASAETAPTQSPFLGKACSPCGIVTCC